MFACPGGADLWAGQEAGQPRTVHHVFADHNVLCQSPALLLHQGLPQIRDLPSGMCLAAQWVPTVRTEVFKLFIVENLKTVENFVEVFET